MLITSLAASGWRNLAPFEMVPGPRATVLYGDNGQGKTNLLEAAYYLVAFRSFRSKHVDDLLAFSAAEARVEATIETGGLSRVMTAQLTREGKAFRLDGKPVQRASSALARLGCVLFVPQDLLLPSAAPAERRRFLDRAIFGVDRAYLREAQAYEKVLRSRNAILRAPGPPETVLLDTYDAELARMGAVLVAKRRAAVASLAPRLRSLFARIHADLPVDIAYVDHASLGAASSPMQIEECLLAGLAERRALDLARRFSGYGPHTHDLAISLAGIPARRHGSQGQLRSLVLALKLAELETLTATLDESPLLLLDDVASELDGERRSRLFEAIARLPGQTLITVTDRDLLPRLPERIDFEVRDGRIASSGASEAL